MARTIIFGGTFDPVHHGHLITAQAAREALAADGVLFIPAAVSPHKSAGRAAPAADRVAMLRAAIAGVEGFAIDERELTRPGPSFTVDTIAELQRERPGDACILLIGADQLPLLHTWRDAAGLLARVEPAILGRPGAVLEHGLSAVGRHLGSPVAERLAAAVLATPLVEISATAIRRRVAAGASIRFLVPPAVEDYIRKHRLYLPS